MINVTTAVRNAIISGELPIKLIDIELSAGTMFLTTAGFDLVWSGNAYLANGFIIDEPKNDLVRELRSSKDQLRVTGVDPTILSQLLTTNQQGRTIIVRDAFLSGGSIIEDPYIVDQYIINGFSGSFSDSEGTITLSLAGEFADFNFKNGIRTTDDSLQRYHPGDRLFKYATDVTKELDKRWGGK